jgi:MFS family permease
LSWLARKTQPQTIKEQIDHRGGVQFGFFMQSLDTTIVNTALPSMAKSLGESPLHMHMVVELACA